MAKLVFGCGYLGKRVAMRWLESGTTVYAVTRRADRAQLLSRWGLQPIVADVTRPQTLTNLPAADTVLFAVGFDRTGDATIQQVYVNGLRTVLEALASPIGRFIYISSTGVHGENDGGWVDEDSACEPVREGGQAHWRAEQLLWEQPIGAQGIVLRLAGIYGPDRVPRQSDLQRGARWSGADGFLNLIHVDDAVEVVFAAEKQAPPPKTYLVSDGHPVIRRDYYLELARLLNLKPPDLPEAAADAIAGSRLGGKRIRTTRMRNELSFQLQFPTYREGLRAILGA